MVLRDRLKGNGPDGHHPFFPPFSAEANGFLVAIDILDIHPNQLAHPCPGRVEGLQNRTIPQGMSACFKRELHQCTRIVFGQHAR